MVEDYTKKWWSRVEELVGLADKKKSGSKEVENESPKEEVVETPAKRVLEDAAKKEPVVTPGAMVWVLPSSFNGDNAGTHDFYNAVCD